jgi:hypothetical protein
MANKPLLVSIAALIGITSLSGYLASIAFTDSLTATDAAVAEDDIAVEQTDVEPSIEAVQPIEPNVTDEQASGLDTKLQAEEESSTAQDRDSRPATAEEEADIRRIAEEHGMVTTPHGNGFDVGPSSDDSHNNPTEARE